MLSSCEGAAFDEGVEDPPPAGVELADEDELGAGTTVAAELSEADCDALVELLPDEPVDVVACERGLLRMCGGPATAWSAGISRIDLSPESRVKEAPLSR